MEDNLITDYNYFDTMTKAQKGYARLMDPICKKWDLTRNELDVLLFLANNPEYDRAADIVANRGIAKSHVSQSVGSLEEKGMLRCCMDPADRRTVRLKLTELSLPIAREGQAAQKRFFDRIHQGLTGEELSLMRKLMQKVCDNIASLED